MVSIIEFSDLNDAREYLKSSENHNPITPEIHKIAADIISNIKQNGDSSLIELTNKFDKTNYTINDLKVTQDEINKDYNSCNLDIISALKLSANRIESYHKKQLPEDLFYEDKIGVKLGWKWTSIETVGLYVPGGQAVYPSSVLMNAIPAKVAGVKKIIMVTPTPNSFINPVVLAAAKIAGINEIYKIGGAQAIASLAFGTKTIPSVNKIVGPGNSFVAAAKMQVYGTVGVDMIAGPSEILVIADNKNNPEWIAWDLLSQAEHDTDARSILITDDKDFAKNVIDEINNILKDFSRKEIAKKSWENNGQIFIVKDFTQAIKISNIIAPEHLEIAIDNPEELLPNITNAGAIFLGRYTPEAVGDYIAGASHVLPTSASAKFSSGLGVFDFIKRSSIISCDENSIVKIAKETELLALEEQLFAHAQSVKMRTL